jgi:hypothetical protein
VSRTEQSTKSTAIRVFAAAHIHFLHLNNDFPRIVSFESMSAVGARVLKSQVDLADLKQRLLSRIRQSGTGHNVIDVVIVREKALQHSNWRVDDFVSIGSRPVSDDCKREALAAQTELQRELDVIWPD